MPCGARDKRRAGHRCLRCRQDHLKCDGARPCSSCYSRGWTCESAKTSNSMVFVEYNSGRSKAPLRMPIVQDAWRYISVFFSAVGLSASPVTSAFSFNTLGALCQGNDLVHKTVYIVGGVYASRNANILNLSLQEKRSLQRSWVNHRKSILERMHMPANTESLTVLLCILLLSLAELMTDETGLAWRMLIHTVSTFIRRNPNLKSPQTDFESLLFRFLRISDILGALCLCEDPALPSTSPTHRTLPSTNQPRAAEERDWDALVDYFEEWARLQARSIRWTNTRDQCAFPSVSPNQNVAINESVPGIAGQQELSEHDMAGIEIICSASRLQRKFIEAILTHATPDARNIEPATGSLLSYYHWGLTGLSWTFLHPAWSSLSCSLPKMEDEMVRKQAIAALEYAEGTLNGVALEAVLYAAIPQYVGMVLRAEEERTRMLGFLQALKAKGFAVASTYVNGLSEAWMELSGTEAGNLAQVAAAAAARLPPPPPRSCTGSTDALYALGC